MFQLTRLGRRAALLSACFGWGCLVAQAQTTPTRIHDRNTNAWLMLFSDVRFAPQWNASADVQLRRNEGFRKPQQNMYRASLNYFLTEDAWVGGGLAHVVTFPYGEYPAAGRSHEHRLFQQLHLRQFISRVTVTHRFRQEQRWLRSPGAADYQFANRTRYRVHAVVPLLARERRPGQPYVAIYDELFIGYGKNVDRAVFDQNRAYGALGWQLSEATSVEAGYLYQALQRNTSPVFEDNHTFQISLFYNPDLRSDD